MTNETKTSVPTIADALGKPDVCPVCGQDWDRDGCVHWEMYAEDLSVPMQAHLYKQLRALDAASKKEGS